MCNFNTTDSVGHAVYCLESCASNCLGICPNPDLSGVGVRAAFYLQSITNALLVVLSPEDSTQGAWASTILTVALIIPALIQKFQGTLSLHHATLVLNFSTLSCVNSLAVAPMCSIWRPAVSTLTDHVYSHEISSLPGERHSKASSSASTKQAQIEASRHRGRIVLSIALVSQIVLQWIWVIILFILPAYSQASCSNATVLVLFGYPTTVYDINHGHFAIWPIWLVFSLCTTLVYGVNLAISSAGQGDGSLSSQSPPSRQPAPPRRSILFARLEAIVIYFLPPPYDHKGKERVIDRQRIWVGNAGATIVFLLYIAVSETQIHLNCILPGENSLQSFGQIAAILLSLAPVWQLVVSIYRAANAQQHGHHSSPSTNSLSYSGDEREDDSTSYVGDTNLTPRITYEMIE